MWSMLLGTIKAIIESYRAEFLGFLDAIKKKYATFFYAQN